MKSAHRETGRQAYIRLLRGRVDATDGLPPDEREHVLWADLIAAGYLDGLTQTGSDGSPTSNVIQGATVTGRLFLQDLEALEEAQTWRARTARYGIPVATFFVGILSSVLIDWLRKALDL
jgi:hypothetical protein